MSISDNNISDTIADELSSICDVSVNIKDDFDLPIYVDKVAQKIDITNKNIMVLSGGGIKGIAYVGVIKAIEELNVLQNFKIIAGTSVGALFAALISLGYSGDELEEFMLKFNLNKLKMVNISNLFENYGLDDGNRLVYMLNRLICAKGYSKDITLGELYENTGITLYITTVCVNTRDVIYINHNDYPQITLTDAVRRSVSIPGYYVPVMYDDNIYIDGGCIDNFPIQLFKDKLDKVLGLNISETFDKCDSINNLESYFRLIYQCFMKGVTINSKKGYEKYTTDINLESINILNYGIDVDTKKELINAGYKAIMDKFMCVDSS